jgi:putative tricarboxylic transport membrane protein
MKRDKIILSFWLLACLYFCIEGWRLGLGSIRMPGSGFLPFWVSVVVGILTIVQLLREIKKEPPQTAQALFRGKRVQNTVYALVFLFAYPLLFDKIGFFVCTFLFTGACLKIIGQRRWFLSVGLSLLVAVASYTLFVSWLQIQFPRGKWMEPLQSLLGAASWK